MKKTLSHVSSVLVSLLVLCAPASEVFAQEIVSITASSKQVIVGADVDLLLTMKPSATGTNNCAVLVDFGNGDSQYVRVTSNNEADLKVPMKVRFTAAGNFTIAAAGKLMVRGLNTLGPCDGNQSEIIAVAEPKVEPPAPAPAPEPTKSKKKK